MNAYLLAALALSALTALGFGAFALYHRAFDRRAKRGGYLPRFDGMSASTHVPGKRKRMRLP